MVLACTVRGCGGPLSRRERSLVCEAGHSFDVARSGYVNLLQPQDRKSSHAGDSPEAIDARTRLLTEGIGRAPIDAIVERAGALGLPGRPVVVDLGSGSGELLAAVSTRMPIDGIGIDLSTAATERASRRYPNHTWVVANADRRLPLVDRSAHVVLSLNARRNAAECARILEPGGTLLVALPAPDDLIELRAQIGGDAIMRERGESVRTEHAPWFELTAATVVRERRTLTRDQLLALLCGTYRGARRSAAAQLDALEATEVTLATEIMEWSNLERERLNPGT